MKNRLFVAVLLFIGLTIISSCKKSSTGISNGSLIGVIDTKAGMKMREGAGIGTVQIGYLPNRAEVEILDQNGPEETIYNKKGRWMKIKYADVTGWVFGGFVKIFDNRKINSRETIGIIDTKVGMKMREGAGTETKQIGYIPNLSEIIILDKNGPEEVIYDIKSRWYKVKYEGKEGWVFGGFIKIISEDKMKDNVNATPVSNSTVNTAADTTSDTTLKTTVKTADAIPETETREMVKNIDMTKISECISELLNSYRGENGKNIAIYPFKGQKNIDKGQLRMINNLITKSIFKDKRFNFVEREFLSSVIQEQELKQTGLTSEVSEIGKIAGAQMLLVYQIKDGIFDCRILDSETALVKAFSGSNLLNE